MELHFNSQRRQMLCLYQIRQLNLYATLTKSSEKRKITHNVLYFSPMILIAEKNDLIFFYKVNKFSAPKHFNPLVPGLFFRGFSRHNLR